MTTVNDVFFLTMSLIDELSDRTGQPDLAETRDYRQRTPGIVTLLIGELHQYSDTYAASVPGKRPVCPPVSGFEDEVCLDDFLCRSVLPYGLAARLLIDENPATAAFYEREYTEMLVKYGLRIPSRIEPIRDIYGGVNAPGECGAQSWR